MSSQPHPYSISLYDEYMIGLFHSYRHDINNVVKVDKKYLILQWWHYPRTGYIYILIEWHSELCSWLWEIIAECINILYTHHKNEFPTTIKIHNHKNEIKYANISDFRFQKMSDFRFQNFRLQIPKIWDFKMFRFSDFRFWSPRSRSLANYTESCDILKNLKHKYSNKNIFKHKIAILFNVLK